jgi:hypothetical protein
MKDGDMFDTKKSTGELESMTIFANTIAKALPYRVTPKFCCFNQEDKGRIIDGSKGRFTLDQVMTGSEFCKLVGIEKSKIVEPRGREAQANLDYFVSTLLSIPAVRQLLAEKIGGSLENS